ncbi:MAG: ribosome-associated translation inhibitor RaiA [Candidatus Eremiobacteraeota bacterium]|nr:ribosome-associated translation inhibitor RaiA [Candidatus Eremiobacteraeota bacterium]MCW5866690.1 ribosome-associated translation inhibitor RaiA [Candidatus Eremiobacteraeota bacterium]
MDITVKGKNFDITDSLRNHAKSKLSKTARFSDNVMTAEVTLATERNWHVAKITLNCKGSDLHAEEKSTDMYNSIDRVVEKLERELKKQREKETNHRAGRSASAPTDSAEDREPESGKKKEKDAYSARIESVQRFTPQSMTVDEAIKELQSSGEDFVGFLNEDTGNFQLIHRKGKGYRIVEPRLN